MKNSVFFIFRILPRDKFPGTGNNRLEVRIEMLYEPNI